MFFFFNDTATTEIYTLSLHDALPIYAGKRFRSMQVINQDHYVPLVSYKSGPQDRKSTRLNSSHSQISYAVFCLKKKKIHAYFCLPLIFSHILYPTHPAPNPRSTRRLS